MSLHQIDKTSFRRAQCRGQLAACDTLCGVNGTDWLRNGKVVAAVRTGLLSSTYYIEGNA